MNQRCSQLKWVCLTVYCVNRASKLLLVTVSYYSMASSVCGQDPERARWSYMYLARSGLPAVSRKKRIP